ncbi:DNA alkylation repair protein [Microbacterium sp. NPDC096154]|uniref:DNA alkylation repair protein n=1 Tax=Microbacterium sp. NPDC096154 TaxID=3155549 RepID=UPI00332D9F3C
MTAAIDTAVADVLAELASLEDPRMRGVNERHGDDHGVNLTQLRQVAKRLKTNHELAQQLWATDVTPAKLVAVLISKPKAYSADDLDRMLREARVPKVRDWLVNYLAKKSPHAERLRQTWIADPDEHVAAAGWALTAEAVAKRPELVDLDALLDTIEAEMKQAPAPTQWEMNTTLAYIGIHHPDRRERALEVGERLQVLKDYPTPPNCTSPYAPAWIGEMVRRQGA